MKLHEMLSVLELQGIFGWKWKKTFGHQPHVMYNQTGFDIISLNIIHYISFYKKGDKLAYITWIVTFTIGTQGILGH